MQTWCKIFMLLGFSSLIMGADCFPLLDLDPSPVVPPGQTLAVSVTMPDADREVAMGDVIEIEWSAANLTGSEAIATILVRSRADLSETILAGGLRLPETGTSDVFEWRTGGDDPNDDADDFTGGTYSIVARVEAGVLTKEASAPGWITINTPPSFEFVEPTEDAQLTEQVDPNDPNATPEGPSVTIRWSALDPDGDGNLELGIDQDPNHDSGNEIIILEREIPTVSGFGSLNWGGTDIDGEQVDPNSYYLYAVLTDSINDERLVDSGVRLTVPAWPTQYELAITDPNEDTTFLTSDDDVGLTIAFTLDEEDDVLVDLEIDTDDDHSNGNEIQILSQRLVEPDDHKQEFQWNGKDSDGDVVAEGIYRILLLVNRETGSPQRVESEGLVFRRNDEEQPLIALLSPSSDQTVEAGADVIIEWRDDDPSETATIRLWLDDDQDADEAPEEGDPPIEILPEPREAAGDGVLDRFRYHVPKVPEDLGYGRYYIRAHIDRDDAGAADHVSVAAGQIVIEEPSGG